MAVDDTESSSSLAEVGGAPETSSRDDVAAAFDAVEARDAPLAEAPVKEGVPPVSEEAPAALQEGRDALGRFAPRRDTPPAPPAAPAPSAQAPAPSPQPELPRHLTRPPASWSPQETQHWDKLPVEAREAVARRETEVQRVMQESAAARQGLSQLQEVLSPYLPNIQAANGGDVVGSIKTFFDYDNRLRHGTQIDKARAITSLIKGYGIDISTLDTELAGAQHSPEQAQQTAIQQALARELAPVRQFLAEQQRNQHEHQLALAHEVDQNLQSFAGDPAHRFYNHVRADMADLLEITNAQGRRMTLNEAYERACWQNPEIRNILIAGQQSAGAQAQHQAAQRARAASVGVRNAPRAGAPGNGAMPENRSRADDIAAAFAAHAGEV
jgi:hypothetical protein